MDEYAGVPLPLEGQDLVVEPSYLFAGVFNTPEKSDAEDSSIRSHFHSRWRRCTIITFTDDDGMVRHVKYPEFHHLGYDLQTLGASAAWGIEQEANAVHLLGGLIRHHQFKKYMLTGMFLESSKRSGVMYLFRRLKPTVAMRSNWKDDSMSILCTLCAHPIAYYKGSWAGAMCPTDDVIAHLMMMRGDEHQFWKVSNQHPAHRPEAGL